MTRPARTAFKARYLFSVAAPPLADGVVTVENGRIVAVEREAVGCRAADLGNVAILPGLINAHTHLEFSGLTSPLGSPGMAFTDWIRSIIAHRPLPHLKARDSASGAAESAAFGVVALGEIARTPWLPADLGRATVFLEAIGLSGKSTQAKLAEARAHLALAGGPWRPGLSPHAPYSVHPEMFDGLIALAAEAGAPVAFHLAETREELELLAGGCGPFRELLIELGAWSETAIPRGTRPIDYLRRLAARRVQALIVHGNYLDQEEIELLAAHAERLSIVYCPRTHDYFGHAPHPLARLLAAGASVALGTDSRASNPDLNLLEEMRFVARRFPELPPSAALELATIAGARALGMEKRLGSIEPGKAAWLALAPLSDRDAADPHWLLYESDQPARPWPTQTAAITA